MPRIPNLVAIVLGQAVNGVLQNFRREMFTAIPFGVSSGIAQSEVRRHVDDFDIFRELGDLGVSGAVRQSAEHDVDLAPVHPIGGDERR